MLHINPKECLMYEEVSLKVSNLQPGQHVTLRCEVTEGKFIYDSYAHFVASLDGIVDPTCDGSFGGSYSGISQMGIFWSMLPAKGQMNGLRYFPRSCMESIEFRLQVYDGHLNDDDDCFQKSILLTSDASVQSPLAEGVVLRKCNAEGVTRHEVKHGRVRGTIFKPHGDGPFKGVIDIYGGAGGINESRVSLLASMGYIAYTLPHHRFSDLVTELTDVEIEYFLEAIEYFSTLNSVQPNIGILAVSAGGPISLFLSTICPKLSAIITFGSPYAFTVPVLYQGNSLKTVRDIDRSIAYYANESMQVDERGGIYYPYFLNYEANDDVAIKVEQSNAKFLIVAGTDDKTVNAWSSGKYMVERMERYGKRDRITLIAYPGVGHFIDPPYMPQTLVQYYPSERVCGAVGGDVIPNVSASIHCWKQILEFLKCNVGTSPKL